MALKTDADSWDTLIRDAERERAKYVDNATQLIRRFAGNYFKRDARLNQPVPENMIFSFLANLLPKLVYDHPKCMVKAARSMTHEPIAAALRHAMDAWAERADLRDELEQLATDFAFGYGVAKIGLEPRGDYQADPSRGVQGHFNMLALMPYAVRIPPGAFLIDVQANSIGEARWMGHQFTRDLDELRNDDRYDAAVIDQLTGLSDEEVDYGKKPLPDKPKSGNGTDRVSLYEIYIVESRQIGTLVSGANGSMSWIRPLCEYIGPEDGPYVMLGAYTVPNNVYPLAPVPAMAEQFMDLNAHAAAAAQEASSAKKIVLVDSTNSNLKKSIMDAPTGSVVAVKGASAQGVVNVEIGGTSVQRLTYIEQLRDRLDRVIGFSDAMRGKTAGATATENEIAASAGDNRTDFIALKFTIGVREMLSRVAWFFFYDPSVVMPVSWTSGAGATEEGIFLGGLQPGQEDLSFTDFAFTIDPYSMAREDPARALGEAQQVNQLAMEIGPAIMQMPWINWRAIIDLYGQAINVPDLASRILSQQGLQMLGQGVLPGMLPGVDAQNAQSNSQQPGMSQQLQPGVQGQPSLNNQPPRMGGAAQMNPGVQAFAQMGYGGRAASQQLAATTAA